MPGEESAILNNSANDFVFLCDGESLPGDLSDLNFTNPEFADNVQAEDLLPFHEESWPTIEGLLSANMSSFQAFSRRGD